MHEQVQIQVAELAIEAYVEATATQMAWVLSRSDLTKTLTSADLGALLESCRQEARGHLRMDYPMLAKTVHVRT